MNKQSAESTQENYSIRETVVFRRGELNQVLPNFELIRVQLDSSVRRHPVDIGALAYKMRKDKQSGLYGSGPYPVVERSLIESRREFLSRFFDHMYTSGTRDSSLLLDHQKVKSFLKWCDENGHSNLFVSKADSQAAYQMFMRDLIHQFKGNKISLKYAYTLQENAKRTLVIFYGSNEASNIYLGVASFPHTRLDDDEVVRDKLHVQFAVHTYLALARGFADLVVRHRAFPYLLKMPNYETFVFISVAGALITPYRQDKMPIYNYEQGRLSTVKEYTELTGCRCGVANHYLKLAHENLSAVNSNYRSEVRLRYAGKALASYQQLFALMTGAYFSEMAKIEYHDSLSWGKDYIKNDFRAVKFRAAGKDVTYNLGSKYGLDVLKDYIELRAWVLNGRSYPYLFFSLSRNGVYIDEVIPLSVSSLKRFWKGICGVFFPSDFIVITPRQIRKYKNLVMHELGVAHQTAATVLNHTSITNINSYMPSSPEVQKAEFSSLWAAVKKAAELISIKQVDSKGYNLDASIPAGHCNSRGRAKETSANPPITPDCDNSQYGCLYCAHYVVHADEEDIKKLLSVLYVASAVRESAEDYKRADELLGELCMRVKYILNKIKSMSNRLELLVEQQEYEVFSLGHLTPFWSHRMERLERWGTIV